MISSKVMLFRFDYLNFFNFIALPDSINNFQPFNYFSKAGMMAVEMSCLPPAVTNKKL